MLKRQRVLLAMLHDAGGRATHLELTKWAFLLRMESTSQGGSSFYGFVPYRFGPFSFCLFQEMDSMVGKGLVERVDERTWGLTEFGRSAGERAEPGVSREARAIVREHRGASSSELLERVYSRHPWYTVNSEVERLEERPVASPAIYTAGYEGLSVDEFLDGLMRHGIQRVVDVRSNPIARRFGYHRSTLERLTGHLGIEYVHVPELGIASSDRSGVEGRAAFARLFESYERSTLVEHATSIDRIARLVEGKSTVLVCMERAACDCHRSRLARQLVARTRLPIVDLDLVG